MDAKVIGLLGTALSALIAAIGYYAKTKHERRRATRTVLYYLLELHHLQSRFQLGVKSFPANYVEQCRSALLKKGVRLTETDADSLRQGLTKLIRQFALSELNQLASEIVEPFTKALLDLSREDPLLAFQLKGKETILQMSKVAAFISETNVSDVQEGVVLDEITLEELDDFARSFSVDELVSSIRAAAWGCGLLTFVKCQVHLKKSPQENILTDLDGKLSPLIDAFVSRTVLSQNEIRKPT